MTGRPSPDPEANGSQPSTELQSLPAIVASIVETARKGRIERLVVTQGDFHLELETGSAPSENPATRTRDAVPVSTDDDVEGDNTSIHIVTSPMIGTFYAAPAPGEPAFVKVGDQVAQGDTIGIVEAMKIMNEIAADRAGRVVEVVATNGETVEYGSPLVRIDLHPQ